MTQKFVLVIITFLNLKTLNGQVIIFPIGIIGAAVSPEHGFLPGKKFQFYPTINKYDFQNHKIRVELFDNRTIVKLSKTKCSDIELTNTSEFNDPDCIYKVGKYIDTLFKQCGGIIDKSSNDTLQVWLEGIDSRLIGFGYVRVHGLCQMKMRYHNVTKTYCVDITDADKNSPVSPNAVVTRKTATRIMASASIREVIEQFFIDLKSFK